MLAWEVRRLARDYRSKVRHDVRQQGRVWRRGLAAEMSTLTRQGRDQARQAALSWLGTRDLMTCTWVMAGEALGQTGSGSHPNARPSTLDPGNGRRLCRTAPLGTTGGI